MENGYWSMLIRVQNRPTDLSPRFIQVQFSRVQQDAALSHNVSHGERKLSTAEAAERPRPRLLSCKSATVDDDRVRVQPTAAQDGLTAEGWAIHRRSHLLVPSCSVLHSFGGVSLGTLKVTPILHTSRSGRSENSFTLYP
jgi:hypothetical protein